MKPTKPRHLLIWSIISVASILLVATAAARGPKNIEFDLVWLAAVVGYTMLLLSMLAFAAWEPAA